MRDLLLQGWTTIRCLASPGGGVTSLTQDEEYWLEMASCADVAFLIDAVDLTIPAGATISLHVETAPTVDDLLFQDVAPPIVFDGVDVTASSTPIQLKAVRTPSTVALAPLLRWRLNVSPGASGPWAITFRIRAIPGRSRFFAPTDISGNVAWFRSDIGVSKDAVTNKVNTWADQSGLAHDLTSAGANRPTWVASSINARPSLSFDPTLGAQFMKTSAFSLGTYTVLMVATGQDPASAIGWFWTRGTNVGGVADTLYGTINSTIYSTRGGITSDYNYGAGGWGQYGVDTAKLLQVSMDGTHAGHTLRINAADVALTSGTAGNPGTGTTSHELAIAAAADGVLPSKTKIAEVIVYDRALGADDLAVVQEYLRRRYGLY